LCDNNNFRSSSYRVVDLERHGSAPNDKLYRAMRNVEIALELINSMTKIIPFIEAEMKIKTN
jgi:hypothetical protein